MKARADLLSKHVGRPSFEQIFTFRKTTSLDKLTSLTFQINAAYHKTGRDQEDYGILSKDPNPEGKMFGILNFRTFLMVVLLFVCSCTYLHGVFPAWLDRNKAGSVFC